MPTRLKLYIELFHQIPLSLLTLTASAYISTSISSLTWPLGLHAAQVRAVTTSMQVRSTQRHTHTSAIATHAWSHATFTTWHEKSCHACYSLICMTYFANTLLV